MDIYLFKGLCSQYTLVPAILVIIFGVVPICLPRNAKHTAAMPSRDVETNLMFKAVLPSIRLMWTVYDSVSFDSATVSCM